MKATTFLVREKGLYSEALLIIGTGALDRFDIGDQVNRFVLSGFPPGDDLHRAIFFSGEQHLFKAPATTLDQVELSGGKAPFVGGEDDALGRATDVLPVVGRIDCLLQTDAIEFAIPQKDDLRRRGDQRGDLFEQGDMHIFGQVAFVAFDYDPALGQLTVDI